MSQTLTSLLAHLVFSTKNRRPIITPEIEPELFALLAGRGGTGDHVHLLVSQLMNGYAAFSVSQREVPMLKRYIAHQKEHHRKQTFKEELLQFLDEYGIDYDERYLWN